MGGRYGHKVYPVQGRAEPEFGPPRRCPKLHLFGQGATGTPPSDADLSLIPSPACGGYPALRDLSPQEYFSANAKSAASRRWHSGTPSEPSQPKTEPPEVSTNPRAASRWRRDACQKTGSPE